MPAALHLAFASLLAAMILYYAIALSSGEAWHKKILRFIGLMAATFPLVGFIELVVFRETDYAYGVACCRIWGVSLIWLGLSQLWRAFS